jgi:pimeloyl-CoA synthetase
MEDRHICIVGDEMDVDDSMKYITTYIAEVIMGYFVRHVFEKIK